MASRDAALELDIDVSTHASAPACGEGVGGVIKQRPEDFVVEEIPLYDASGEGEHAYLTLRRRSMATLEVVRLLASHFRVPRKSIGYAGLKDKHAVTTQTFSVRLPTSGVDDYPPLHHDRVEVVSSTRHGNKLRRGHLRGNRFVIRIREVDPQQAARARAVLDEFARIGAPARFGPQRFGHMERNHLLGRALVLGDCQQFLDLLLGPCTTNEAQQEGRERYAAGDYQGAMESYTASLKPERAALRRLAMGGSAKEAVLAIGRVERSFYGSAFQSAVFNSVLDERIADGSIGELFDGDVAMTYPHRAVVGVDASVLDAPDTAERLANLELSPTGPMWGRALKLARGATGEAEVEALARIGVTPEDIDRSDRGLTGPLEGARRPLRVPVTEHDVRSGEDEHGAYIECAFVLPRGAFATTILADIMATGTG